MKYMLMMNTPSGGPYQIARWPQKDIQAHIGYGIDLILDGGVTLNQPSTVIDLTGSMPVVLREGKGAIQGVLQ